MTSHNRHAARGAGLLLPIELYARHTWPVTDQAALELPGGTEG